MAEMLYHKRIKFGAVPSVGSVPTTKATFAVPVSTKSKAEIQTAWSNATNTIAGLVQALKDCGCGTGGFPFYDPGYSTRETIVGLTYYNEAMSLMPLSSIFPGSMGSYDMTAYCDENGSGIYGIKGSSIYFRYNNTNTSIYSAGYNNTLGVSAAGNAGSVTPFLIFFSSDGFFGLVRLGYNRNNSHLGFESESLSEKIKTWIESLPTAHWADGQYSDAETITDWEQYVRIAKGNMPMKKLCRLRFLNPDGSTAFSIDNDPMNRRSGAFVASGSLNVNLQNGTRRTADVTLNNVDAAFDYNYNKVWFGTEIALDMGVMLVDGTEFYLPQGVFRVVTPTEDVNPSGNSVHFQLSDKWSGLDGTLNGNLEASYIVNDGTNIFSPISTLLASDRGDGQSFDRESPIFTEYYNGKTQALPDGTSAPLTNAPYDLVVDSDDGTIAELILQLCGMVNAWVGYDRSGRLRIDPSQDDIDDADKPVLWRFSMDETQLISMAYESKISDVKNDYIVVGMQASDYSQPAARVQNLDPQSDVNINLIGRRTKRESKPEFATQQICEDYAVWMAKRTAVLHKAVTISCSQLFHLEENGLIEIIRTDKNPAVAELHLIQGFSIPLATDQPMSITATSVNDFPDVTITAWPPEE